MPKRITETYAVGEAVQVTFDGDFWLRGEIAAHEHPGVWVRLASGSMLFVTNLRRIRKLDDDDHDLFGGDPPQIID